MEKKELPEDFMKKLYKVNAKDWKYEISEDGIHHYKTQFSSERTDYGTKISNDFKIDVYRTDRFYPHVTPIYGMTITYSKEESIEDSDGFSALSCCSNAFASFSLSK